MTRVKQEDNDIESHYLQFCNAQNDLLCIVDTIELVWPDPGNRKDRKNFFIEEDKDIGFQMI